MVRSLYRFGFVFTTRAGNDMRYLNLRRYAERDPGIECVWALDPGTSNPEPGFWHHYGVNGRTARRTGWLDRFGEDTGHAVIDR